MEPREILFERLSTSAQTSLNDGFSKYISALKADLELHLSNILSSLQGYKLYPQMQHALLSRGKRLRPLLTVMSGVSVGGEAEKLYPLAAALELIHTASLVHDDVLDEDSKRRAVDTLYKQWKNKAILAGDTFYALACYIITMYGPEIWRAVSEGAMELCDGQFMDVTLTLTETDEDEYMQKISKKSASLFKVAAKSGAIVGGADMNESEALSWFGYYFGRAYQLRDDLKEFLSDINIAIDLRNARVTLPYIHLYTNCNEAFRKLLQENFGKKRVSTQFIRHVRAEVSKINLQSYCEKKIEENLNLALKELEKIRVSPMREYLSLFAESVLRS